MSVRRSPAVAVAVAVLVVGGVGAALAHQSARLPLPAGTAIRDALHDPPTVRALHGVSWTRSAASAVDGQLERVSFYAGARIVAEVAVRADGTVQQAIDFRRLRVPYGDWIAYEPSVLLGLSLLFVLMAGVAPLRRQRNADVLAVLSLIAPVVLLQYRYVGASVLSAVPGLGYLMVRCAWLALGPGSGPAAPSTPLFERVTVGWDVARRVRLLRIVVVATAVVFALVGISSPDAVDVIYAVMEGATKLIHGVLPYGHLPGDVIHGDTYPILSYALYTPLAWIAPVSSTWDSVDGALAVAVLTALASAGAVFRAAAGRRGRRGQRRAPEAELAGLRAALVWLAFPPVLITVSTGTTDVVLAGFVVVAVVLWRRPSWCSAVLALGGWFKLAPFALVPLLLAPLRGRRLAGAAGAFALVSGAMIALLLAVGGIHGPGAMIRAVSYQFSRGDPQSVWSVLGLERLQPVGQAAVLALIAGAAVRLRRDPALAGDRVRIAALAAAILIGLELAADYWAFLYVIWVVPLLSLSVLSDAVPQPRSEPVRATSEARGLVPVLGR
jgi:hypothetical protein